MTRKLRRSDAAAYLADKFGIPCSVGTLANYATSGAGPKFELSGRWPIYSQIDLDAWAQNRISAPSRRSDNARAA